MSTREERQEWNAQRKDRKNAVKVGIIFAVFAVLYALPEVMRDQLGMALPAWSWTTTFNPFTDWSVYYLVWVPAWLICGVVMLTGPVTVYRLARYTCIFALRYWLFYDWGWWSITAIFSPASFSWTMTFYFSVMMKPCPMWVFFLVAVLGFVLSIACARAVKRGRQLVPFIVYLTWIYLPGGIDLAWPQSPVFFSGFDIMFIIAILATAAFTLPREYLVAWVPREERVEKIKQ